MNDKNKIIILIVFLTLFGISLILGMIKLMNRGFDFIFGFDIEAKNMILVDSYETEDKEINKLGFDLYSTDVEIKESENNNLKVEYYSSKEKNDQIKVENNTIILNEKKYNTTCFGICNNQRKVIVYLPADYNMSFDIATRSGDIKSFIDLKDKAIDITTVSGDVMLEDTTNIDLTTTSGDIKMGNTNNSNISTTSGDISVGEANILNIQTTSGGIRINKITEMIKLNTTSGDVIVSDLNITANSRINTISGDVLISSNNSDCYVETSTISGDTRIGTSNRKSDIVLSIKTTSGDISVN